MPPSLSLLKHLHLHNYFYATYATYIVRTHTEVNKESVQNDKAVTWFALKKLHSQCYVDPCGCPDAHLPALLLLLLCNLEPEAQWQWLMEVTQNKGRRTMHTFQGTCHNSPRSHKEIMRESIE